MAELRSRLEFGGIGGIIGSENSRGDSMKSVMATLSCASVLVTFAFGQGYKPPQGYVPDSATAVQIAEAVLVPVYGKKQIESEKPLTAKLEKDVWTVSGTLQCPDGKGGTTTQCVGGTAEVQISKTDARIILMMHYK